MTQTGGSFTYEYDDNGNITRVVQDGVETAYTYDALGQLIRVDDEQENATWVYEYDQGGNILSKKKYVDGVETESMDFEYTNENWRDQLTKVNDKTITYDQIGNPLNDGEWTYTWQNGRQLQKMQKSGVTVEFVYNENGLRVQKTATSTGVTKYTLHGKNIVHMTQGNNELHFFYDAQNKPAVAVYNGVPYSYVKNLQGDIVAILDSNKNVVVSYVYDAWGRPISCSGAMASTLGKINPFRYRGYVYDEETGLYYLRSRYYHASLCRFISNDSLIKGNLYTYCGNKPVCNEDANGFAFISCREANGDDTNFMPSIMCGGDGYLIAGIARLPRKKSIQQRVADKGVTFNPSNDEYGGEIVNSYKLNPLEMIVYTEFLKDEYGDIYEGTAVGFYFEWAVHDFAYAFFSLVGNEKKVEQSKNLDFGATIYDDKHDAFSLFMFTTYQVLFPFHSLIDRYVHITQ